MLTNVIKCWNCYNNFTETYIMLWWVVRFSVKQGRDISASSLSQFCRLFRTHLHLGSPHPACQCKVGSSHCRSVIGHYLQFTGMKLPVKPFKSAHLTERNLMGWLFCAEVKRLFRRLYTNIIFSPIRVIMTYKVCNVGLLQILWRW